VVHYVIRWVECFSHFLVQLGCVILFFAMDSLCSFVPFQKIRRRKNITEQTIGLCFFGNTFTVIVLYCCHNYFEPHVLDNMVLSLRQLQLMSCNFRQCCNWSFASENACSCSLILLRDVQTITYLYWISTWQPLPCSTKQGSGALLMYFVQSKLGAYMKFQKWALV
jgi:hypothetical protein